jgi:hypothetical protein
MREEKKKVQEDNIMKTTMTTTTLGYKHLFLLKVELFHSQKETVMFSPCV